MRPLLRHIAFGLSFSCVLTAYASTESSKSAAKDQPQASSASLLQSSTMSPESLATSMQPNGSIAGQWAGTWDGFIVTFEADSEPATLTFTPQESLTNKTVKRGVITAQVSRKGRIITIGDVSCLFQMNKREWNVRHNNCEVVQSGSILELVRGKTVGWTIRADNASIQLSKR
jgi:hypothetical protein